MASDENDQSPNYAYILFETTALTLKFLRTSPDQMAQLQSIIAPSLNVILEKNRLELMGYAFQIYALFVASSLETSPNQLYQALATSALDSGNWGKDMKYLIPSLAQFMTSMICKFPEDMK